ncbi:RNA polymerase III transcription factor (TF)IIIC subunit domain-containing protein [Phthorimaea operculella]|nr:RNA polymerase III transcription factor (TF)IIIC subunit domain-containing protein [Phthorimaea operculella]
MENMNENRDLMCVLFPGLVKNEERAIQCLGGIRNISQVYSNPNKKRLGLNFQPENPYVKRVFGDVKRTAGVLLKVKVKKKKVENRVEREVISTSVLGKVRRCYKFESMCDFQYMPVDRFGDGPLQCILEHILPSGLDDVSFITEPSPVPLFIVPTNFTRSDKPVSYSYTDKRYISTGKTHEAEDLHGRIRLERGHPLAKFSFNLIDDIPTEPNEYYLRAAKIDTVQHNKEMFEKIKKMFEERPVWSQNLIRFHTKYRLVDLKIILPCLAIRMENGPWRMLWVRYGYDPRKEPEARKYQTLDFRLRHQAGLHSLVLTRDQVSNYKKADRVKQNRRKSYEEPSSSAVEEVSEAAVYFRPGMVPAQRQIFYMLCDVKIPEIEAILAPEPPPGFLCHQKRGWLPHNTGEICRDIVFKYVTQALLATHNTDLRFEQGGSSDEGSSDDAHDDSSSDEPSTSASKT